MEWSTAALCNSMLSSFNTVSQFRPFEMRRHCIVYAVQYTALHCTALHLLKCAVGLTVSLEAAHPQAEPPTSGLLQDITGNDRKLHEIT
jgi:hypothetical protein